MNALYPVIAVIAAYLIGSLSFAVIVSRVMGLNDPRTYGSGNPGATNVLRSGSKAAAAVTLVLDALKGLVPVVLVKAFGEPFGLGDSTVALAGLAAFLGHLYPVFFGFKGGKGVATAAGMLLGLYPPAALLALAAWALTFLLTRTSSLASLIATPLTLPLLAWQQPEALLPMCVLTGLIVWRHRGNLRDLFAGRERHF